MQTNVESNSTALRLMNCETGRRSSQAAQPSIGVSLRNREEPLPRVLIVDNSRRGALALLQCFQTRGHITHCAQHGIDALIVAEATQPDLVILEMGWPGRGNRPTPMLLRNRPWAVRTVLIAYSRYRALSPLVSEDFDYCLSGPIVASDIHELYCDLRAATWGDERRGQ